MRTPGFTVAIEPYLVRKGMISLLSRIPGIRIDREFSDPVIFQQYAQKQELDFLVISRSFFDACSGFFVDRPGLLEKTLLLTESSNPEMEEHNSIFLSDEKEKILAKITKMTALHQTGTSGGTSSELTQREKTIVRQVSLGLTNKQIAEALFLSTHTVTTHRKNISSKLGIKSVSGLTVYAIVNNIITIEELSSKPSQ